MTITEDSIRLGQNAKRAKILLRNPLLLSFCIHYLRTLKSKP